MKQCSNIHHSSTRAPTVRTFLICGASLSTEQVQDLASPAALSTDDGAGIFRQEVSSVCVLMVSTVFCVHVRTPATSDGSVLDPNTRSIYYVESVQVVGRRSILTHSTLWECGGVVNMHRKGGWGGGIIQLLLLGSSKSACFAIFAREMQGNAPSKYFCSHIIIFK